jgi:hypothetical protein
MLIMAPLGYVIIITSDQGMISDINCPINETGNELVVETTPDALGPYLGDTGEGGEALKTLQVQMEDMEEEQSPGIPIEHLDLDYREFGFQHALQNSRYEEEDTVRRKVLQENEESTDS